MKRMNLGCGSVQPKDWDNVDAGPHGQEYTMDVVAPMILHSAPAALRRTSIAFGVEPFIMSDYDYIVCNHMLSDIGHHDLVPALRNIRSMLRDSGVLRLLVPSIGAAFTAWQRRNEGWFPQDERTGGLDAKFCTFITWFGESRSVFTYGYLRELLEAAGFTPSLPLHLGEGWFADVPGITELDGDRTTSLIVEAKR